MRSLTLKRRSRAVFRRLRMSARYLSRPAGSALSYRQSRDMSLLPIQRAGMKRTLSANREPTKPAIGQVHLYVPAYRSHPGGDHEKANHARDYRWSGGDGNARLVKLR